MMLWPHTEDHAACYCGERRENSVWTGGQEEAGLDLGCRGVSGEEEEGIKEIVMGSSETLL